MTCVSCIASSSADCVFGEARLISSTSRTFAKTGPGRKRKPPFLLVVDVHAGDVRRQQVGRELEAREPEVERARERLREHRLADARHVLDEHVALGEQAEQRQPQRLGGCVHDGREAATTRSARSAAARAPGRLVDRRAAPSALLEQPLDLVEDGGGDRGLRGARDESVAVGGDRA